MRPVRRTGLACRSLGIVARDESADAVDVRSIANMSERADLITRLRAGLPDALAGTEVFTAYLFGSLARATASARSDIDLGVALGRPSSLDEVLDLYRRIYAATGLEVDLVVLDEAPLRLLHRVMLEGVNVYCDDEVQRVRFESRIRKVGGDFAIHAEWMDREMLAAIARGDR